MLLGGQHSIPGRLSIPNKTRFTDYFTEGTRRALGKAGMRTPARYLACRLSEGRGSSLEFAPLASGFPSPAPTLSGPIGICLFFLLFSQQPFPSLPPALPLHVVLLCPETLPWAAQCTSPQCVVNYFNFWSWELFSQFMISSNFSNLIKKSFAFSIQI